MDNLSFIGIIPARYASSRFPGKPLAMIGDKPMIQRVYEQAKKVLADVYVATDDSRIYDAVECSRVFWRESRNDKRQAPQRNRPLLRGILQCKLKSRCSHQHTRRRAVHPRGTDMRDNGMLRRPRDTNCHIGTKIRSVARIRRSQRLHKAKSGNRQQPQCLVFLTVGDSIRKKR